MRSEGGSGGVNELQVAHAQTVQAFTEVGREVREEECSSSHTHAHTHTSQTIISDGVKVNASPSSLTLPPLSEPQEFDLLCIPLEAGELNILGYEATVFGVHNKCMVKISGVFPATFSSLIADSKK